MAMQFHVFAQTLQKLESQPSRLEMMYELAALYKAFDLDEIVVASYLLQGSLAPQYLSLEFQLSTKMVVRALAQTQVVSGASRLETKENAQTALFAEVVSPQQQIQEQLLARFKQLGDIGALATEVIAAAAQPNQSPSIREVHEQLTAIALEEGAGSQERKVQQLADLLLSVDAVSAKFIARVVVGKLRLGFSVMTVLDALSWAVAGSKEQRKLLEDAYQKRADVGELAREYLSIYTAVQADFGRVDLAEIAVRLDKQYVVAVGIPVVPALCQRLNSAVEIIEKMTEVIAEPKYDGLRIQLHYSRAGFAGSPQQKCRAFTRSLEEVTHMFPELMELEQHLSCESCILDAEAIGYDSETGKLAAFQATITRKRKHQVTEAAAKVPIRFYVFDCLFLNGDALIDKKLQDRKEVLSNLFKNTESLMHSPTITTTDPNVLHDFHEEKLNEGLEGAVIKKTDSVYQSGRRGWSWVKIKEAEGTQGKLKDTLDLVVMGYYFGKGKRSSFGVGAFLVGVLQPTPEAAEQEFIIASLAKIGTGLTDEQFYELKSRCDSLAVESQPQEYSVDKNLAPDVFVRPSLVVEIAADELTISQNHTSGFSLRFPRLVRFRDDKQWRDATAVAELSGF